MQTIKIASSHPYFLPFSFGLTGSGASESSIQTTDEALEDISLLGGTTNLAGAQVQIGTITGGSANLGVTGPYRSADKFPMLAAFGKRDSARPYVWNEAPYPLLQGNRLRAVATNSGVETGGHLVLMGQPRRTPEAIDFPVEGNMFFLKVDANFTGVAGQEKNDTTKRLGFDVLVVGAMCDFAQEGTSVRITDADGDIWNPPDIYTPGWAVAGRPTAQMPVMRWGGMRYRLPAQSVMRVAFKNDQTTPETNRTFWFACYQLTQESR